MTKLIGKAKTNIKNKEGSSEAGSALLQKIQKLDFVLVINDLRQCEACMQGTECEKHQVVKNVIETNAKENEIEMEEQDYLDSSFHLENSLNITDYV